jgi:tetratricopeptide (TPR) repeat protein
LPELYRSRAEFLAQQHDHEAALRDLRKAVELESPPAGGGPGGDAGATHLGREHFLAEDHVRMAHLFQLQGKNDEAVDAYKSALKWQPDHLTALRLGAVALLELRRFEEAAASLDRYLEVVNKSARPTEPPASVADAHKLRGLTRAQLGDYGGALHDHTRALDIQPDAATFVHRGWVYLIQGAAAAALRDFESAVRLDPSGGEAHVGRAQARQKLGQTREAVRDAETGLKLRPVTPRLLLVAAEVFAQAGADAGGRARATAEQRRAWTQKSVSLVSAALAKVPAEQRSKFWQEQVLADKDLEPLHRLPEFQQIAPKPNR